MRWRLSAADFATEMRRSARRLFRAKVRTALVVIVLGVALSANAVVFGVLQEVLFRDPRGVVDPGRVVRFAESYVASGRSIVREQLSYPAYQKLQARLGSSASLAGALMTTVSVGEGIQSRRQTAGFVSQSFFSVLGIRPALGRTFAPGEDEAPYGSPVVVLGHDFWRRQLGGDSAAISQNLRIDDATYRIVGILAEGFAGLDGAPVDMWIPMSIGGRLLYGDVWDFNSNAFWIQSFARLAPGISLPEVARRLSAGNAPPEAPRTVVSPLNRSRGGFRPMEAKVSIWIEGVAFIVLLVACANIGNVLLVSSIERRTEFAVRRALGGGPADAVLSLVCDAVILTALSAALATLLASVSSPLVLGLLPERAAGAAASASSVVKVTSLLCLGVVAITVVVPLTGLRRLDLQTDLRGGTATTSAGARASHLWLLSTQVALTAVLLYGAVLFLRSFRALTMIDQGFQPEKVIVVDIDPRNVRVRSEVERDYMALAEMFRRGGIGEAAIGITAPFLSGLAVRVETVDGSPVRTESGDVVYINGVGPSFFSVMGMRLIDGSLFPPTLSSRVTVITQEFARTVWPGKNPVGRCVYLYSRTNPCLRVTGIVADPKRDKISEAPTPQFFVPLEQAPSIHRSRLLFVRTEAARGQAITRIVRIVQSQLPHSAYPIVRPLADVVASQRRPWALGALLFTVFSSIALSIACVGLYNVLRHDLRSRERELAIRLTLGAGRADLLRAVAKDSGLAATAGLVAGLVAAIAMGRQIEPLLFRTPGIDHVGAGAVLVIVSIVAVGAVAVPVSRAARIDPAKSLRSG